MKLLLLAGVALAISTAMATAQDLAAGEQSFRKCLPCHAVGDNARNKVGPVLNGLEGRKSGTVEGYSYSEANKKADITWSAATFKDYIQNPMAKVPGTKMAFAGVKNEKEIENLWAYLAQFKADGTKKQ
jgi:cytochrome c